MQSFVIPFFVAAYLFAWLPFGVAILAARGAFDLPAPQPVFLALATLGVCLAGIGMAAAEAGREGVHALLVQVVRWDVRPRWYAAALLGPALLPAVALMLGVGFGNAAPQLPPPEVLVSFPLLLLALFVPALFEEIGWRGYALPRLQRHMGLLAASLVLGVVWAGMHLPLWLLPDFGFAGQSVVLYFIQVSAISVLLAQLYQSTGGSLLLTGLAHAAVNGWPMLWAPAVLALSEEARAIPFQLLITAATVLTAGLVVLVTESRTRRAERLYRSAALAPSLKP